MSITLELSGFTGTEQYYNGFGGVKLTDGVFYVTDNGASWLVSDVCVICKVHPKVRGQEFVSVTCVAKNGTAKVTYDDGNGNVLYTQKYGYTDLADQTVKFYYTGGVLMLAGEY